MAWDITARDNDRHRPAPTANPAVAALINDRHPTSPPVTLLTRGPNNNRR
jgi:hypothetical protein